MDAPGRRLQLSAGKPETTPCHKAATPTQKKDLTRMSSPAQNTGVAAFPALGGAAPTAPPCQAALLPKLEIERRQQIETSL